MPSQDAYRKTPDVQSYANIHHLTLLERELLGHPVQMEHGFPIIAGPDPVQIAGASGVLIQESPEADALNRWQAGEFLDLERQLAKAWRLQLARADLTARCGPFIPLVRARRPASLAEARSLSYSFLATQSSEELLALGLAWFRVDPYVGDAARNRFTAAARPSLLSFAPYMHHLLEVDAFLYTSIAASLIGAERASNAVDAAYLYYLPFCMVFASSDNLHARVVPQFLKPHQSFVPGQELKADLRRIDAYYSALPEDVRRRGLWQIARFPPFPTDSVVTRLYDKHCPLWRRHAAEQRTTPRTSAASIMAKVRQMQAASKAPSTSSAEPAPDPDYVAIRRELRPRKGKWLRFPPPSK